MLWDANHSYKTASSNNCNDEMWSSLYSDLELVYCNSILYPYLIDVDSWHILKSQWYIGVYVLFEKTETK